MEYIEFTMTMNAHEIDALRARFQSHLPQYETLWRSMIQNNQSNKQQQQQQTMRREPLTLLTAIENKTTVTINVTQHQISGKDCDNCEECSPPTYEELYVDTEADCLVGSNSASPSPVKEKIASEVNNSNDPSDADESDSDATQDTQPTLIRIKKTRSRTSSSSTCNSPSSNSCRPISFDLSGMEPSLNTQKGVDDFLGLEFENLNFLETTEDKRLPSHDEQDYPGVRNTPRSGHNDDNDNMGTQSTTLNNQPSFDEWRGNDISTPQEVKVDQLDERSDVSSSGSAVVHFDISFLMDHESKESTIPSSRASNINSVTRATLLPHRTPPTQDLFGAETDLASLLSPAPLNNQSISKDELVDTPSPQPDAGKPKSRAKARIVIKSSSEDDSNDSAPSRPWLISHRPCAEYGDENSWQNSSQGGSELENDTEDEKSEPDRSRDSDVEDIIALTSDSESHFEHIAYKDHLLISETIPILRKLKKSPRNKTASFRRNRDALTKSAFDEFNGKVFNGSLSGVKFEWSNKLRTTGGITHLKRLINIETDPTYFATIDLSEKVLDEEHRMRSTLLHEMCHAATWIIDKVAKPAHGSVFKKWGRYATKKTGIVVTTTHSYAIQYKFAWACQTPKCGVVIQRHSRSVDIARHVCGRCKGKLIEIDAPQKGARKSEIIKTPKKETILSGYNLFIKQTSREVRERLTRERKQEDLNNPKVTQSDVLKECARLWKQTKTILP